jgi:hypothetical protein
VSPNKVTTDTVLDEMNNEVFMSLIKRKVKDRAVLLYCEDDIVMDLKNSNVNFM